MEKTPRLIQLESLLQESPTDSFLLFAIAKEYESMGQSDLAVSQYKQLLEKDPNYVGTYYHLGKLLELAGRTESAVTIYDKGIQVAEAQGDQHSKRELAEARLNLVD